MQQKGFPDSRRSLPALFLVLCVLFSGIAAEAQGTQFGPEQLVSLVAPVALYPDDLLTNVLTAATEPEQVVQAAQYVKSAGGKVTSMPDTEWDPSVKALLYFPDVLNKMSGDLNWTQQLGSAVINQMQDVLNAVQTFRGEAMKAGNLQTTQQQKVVTEQNIIQIVPSDPEVIYVPQYEPAQVVNAGYPGLAFATGVAVSNWWHYNNVNWGNGTINVYPNNLNHFNYRPGGYYYNNYVPRPGYTAPGVWRPVATPYGVRGTYGNTAARYGTTAAGNTAVRRGTAINTGNTYNVNTGGNTANVNRFNSAATTTSNRLSTSQISSQLQQGLKSGGGASQFNSQLNQGLKGLQGGAERVNRGGAFNGLSSGAPVRQESVRGFESRSSFQNSSMNRAGGGFNRGGGRRR